MCSTWRLTVTVCLYCVRVQWKTTDVIMYWLEVSITHRNNEKRFYYQRLKFRSQIVVRLAYLTDIQE